MKNVKPSGARGRQVNRIIQILDTHIVSRFDNLKLHRNTRVSKASHNCRHLPALIAQRRLTDCLECLEEQGYTEERAILMIAFLQGGAA